MKTVQIMGPSYCGSTVLGYMLNTVDGWFFASEMYRALPYHKTRTRKNLANGYPFCSICHDKCEYWNAEIKSKLNECKTHTEAYNVFRNAFPNIEVFVDGSKSTMWYKNTLPYKRIVAVKHPFRLIASYLYNKKRNTYPCDTLESLNFFFNNNIETVTEECSQIIRRLNDAYDSIFDLCNKDSRIVDFHICKTDQLHIDNFAELDKLKIFLNINNSVEALLNFSKQNDIHPIGGNKAPLWQVSQKNISNNIRYQYYASANGFMDYKIDNKFHIILDGLIPHVENIEGFSSLATKLGYINEKY